MNRFIVTTVTGLSLLALLGLGCADSLVGLALKSPSGVPRSYQGDLVTIQVTDSNQQPVQCYGLRLYIYASVKNMGKCWALPAYPNPCTQADEGALKSVPLWTDSFGEIRIPRTLLAKLANQYGEPGVYLAPSLEPAWLMNRKEWDPRHVSNGTCYAELRGAKEITSAPSRMVCQTSVSRQVYVERNLFDQEASTPACPFMSSLPTP